VRLPPIIAATVVASAIPSLAAESRGLSLREAQTLPAPVLSERVLGAVGALYAEIERPGQAITRGRAFTIAFASLPRPAGYPGLCEAETVTVEFEPAADGPATSIAYVQSFRRGRVYRIVSDTAPRAGGWTDSYRQLLAAQCASAGPVLSRPSMAAPRFFSGSYYASSDFWAAHAYFGARALAMVSSRGSPPAQCRDDIARPGDNICDDASALLRNPPMERFLGFDIYRCEQDAPDLCVTASFSRGPRPDTRGIAIHLRTSLSEPLYPPPAFALREIRIHATQVVS
jgi:hypothetical protein